MIHMHLLMIPSSLCTQSGAKVGLADSATSSDKYLCVNTMAITENICSRYINDELTIMPINT